jgi:cystathionine beta-lyase
VTEPDLSALRRRRSAKWRAYEPDVLPAWIAEMDYDLAEPIARALHAAVDLSDTGYAWGADLPAAAAAFATRRWGWSFDPTPCIVLPDVLTGIALSLRYGTSPGDSVVVTPPVYPPFFSTTTDVADRSVVEVPLLPEADGGYRYDLDGLASAFARPDVTAFLFCHPHNPTGLVADHGVLTAIAGLAAEHGVLVVSDEIHAPLVLPGAEHIPYLSVAGPDAHAVALVSASKAWNLAGLKASLVVPTASAAEAITSRVPLEHVFSTGHLGVIAAEAAFADGTPWLEDVVARLDSQRGLLGDLLAHRLPRAGYRPPQASFLAWVDLRAYDLGADPAAIILERARLAVSSGPTFGREGAGFVRLNIATSPELLAQFVDRIASVVQ